MRSYEYRARRALARRSNRLVVDLGNLAVQDSTQLIKGKSSVNPLWRTIQTFTLFCGRMAS